MRCATCDAENDDRVKKCSSCGARLPRSSRRRDVEPLNSWAGQGLDDRAFRVAVWGLIPVAGLVLGPAAVAMGLAAIRRARATAREGPTIAALTAIVIGGADLLANWLGVGLILLGFARSSGP